MEEQDRRIAGGEPCIFAFWHSGILALTYAHRNRGAGVLISRHRDGELISRVVRRLGFRTARGSSTRGGAGGLREMIAFLDRGHIVAVTPDGPRGPAERVKPGLVYLASRTGRPVVPAASAAGAEWRLNSWDGFRIPKPFARVIVGYGAPVHIPEGIDSDHVLQWQERLTQAVNAITLDLQARVAPGATAAGGDAAP
jgi:lysophospholipid acyltransferase (LPLAT)-like uncharacterized protein